MVATASILSACEASAPVQPTLPSVGAAPVDTSRVSLPSLPRLDAVASNANLCDEGTPLRNSAGKIVSWNMTRKRYNVAASRGSSQVDRYQMAEFDSMGNQTSHSNCVLPRGAASDDFAQNHRGSSRSNLVGMFQTANAVAADNYCVFWPDGSWGCIFDNSLIIGNGEVYCPSVIMATRTSATRTDSVARAPGTVSSLLASGPCYFAIYIANVVPTQSSTLAPVVAGTMTVHYDDYGGGWGGSSYTEFTPSGNTCTSQCGMGGGGGNPPCSQQVKSFGNAARSAIDTTRPTAAGICSCPPGSSWNGSSCEAPTDPYDIL